MEYISAAGFRKVANNERCFVSYSDKSNSAQPSQEITDDNENRHSKGEDADDEPIECSYSLKQTHYHCLICDACVLNRAQLSSHKHK